MAKFKAGIKSAFRKFFGFLLLIFGVLIIIWALYSSHQIFSAKKPAPEIFKSKEDLQTSSEKSLKPNFQRDLFHELGKIFPKDFGPKLFNLLSWSLFATLSIFGGYKLGLLGIKLIR